MSTRAPLPHWHILGLGSIGTLSAYYLLQAGFSVSALPRTPTHITSRTLHFPTQRPPITLSICSDEYCDESAKPITHLWLTVKAHATAAALRQWLPRLADDVTIVCLQNGMGTLDKGPLDKGPLDKATLDNIALPPKAQIIYASSTSGAWRDADQVTVAAENATLMGNGLVTAPNWFAALQPHFHDLQWHHDIDAVRWQKLTVNAVINPLTALYQCRNGELLDGAEREQAMLTLATEIDQLCSILFPPNNADASTGWRADTFARSKAIAEKTAANTSSMCADILAGRSTEIDFINGFLLRAAARNGLTLPFNQHCVARIAARTSERW